MKVVLFCGGLGMRLREYSEVIPKPMIPVGNQPILWHVMDYYSRYGHRDFVLCLGYKANAIKEFFVNARPELYADLLVSQGGSRVQVIGEPRHEWRIAMIDTGVWRSIGARLLAVRSHVEGEEIFCANYSDGLTDLNLDEMVARFRASGKVACFLAVRPPLTYHLASIDADGRVRAMVAIDKAEIWINGGYFLFTPRIFDYLNEGEELVVEPFARLIAENQLLAYKYDGFFRGMDTLRDRQVLEEMYEKGTMPWRIVTEASRSVA